MHNFLLTVIKMENTMRNFHDSQFPAPILITNRSLPSKKWRWNHGIVLANTKVPITTNERIHSAFHSVPQLPTLKLKHTGMNLNNLSPFYFIRSSVFCVICLNTNRIREDFPGDFWTIKSRKEISSVCMLYMR